MKKSHLHKTNLEQRLEEAARLEAEAEAEAARRVDGDKSMRPDQSEGPATVEESRTAEVSAEASVKTGDEQLLMLEAELDLIKDQLLRTRADFDNYRKRIARETENMRKRAAESLLLDLLPVVDNLELAVQHRSDRSPLFTEGVELVLKQLKDILVRTGLRVIPAVGERFNPAVHEALAKAPSATVPEDHVAEEYQKGYILGEMVLRPSKVVVSSGPENGDGAELNTQS